MIYTTQMYLFCGIYVKLTLIETDKANEWYEIKSNQRRCSE